ncbi:MAG TPA: biliverdin-producing heme oxygenase [Phycisphaerae bacterium]|nr:biliverdin-producing heme oxygenase [Phycisphaerae bacterium]
MNATMTDHNASIMLRLKEYTQSLHDATEDGAFNQELVKGHLPRERYVEMLAQLWLIHRTLEGQLRAHAGSVSAFHAVLRDYQYQEPYLAADLAFFGRTLSTIEPLPATKRLMDRIDAMAANEPAGLLGMHYVFEGSNNGSKFIAKAVRRAYALDGDGTRYLDPYGENQRAYWQQFKDDMNAVVFSASQTDAILQAAGAAFEGVMQLHKELQESPATANAGSVSAPASAPKCPFHAAAR